MLSKEVSRTIFEVFGMTQPGIELWSLGPLVNTLPKLYKTKVFFRYLVWIIDITYIWSCFPEYGDVHSQIKSEALVFVYNTHP